MEQLINPPGQEYYTRMRQQFGKPKQFKPGEAIPWFPGGDLGFFIDDAVAKTPMRSQWRVETDKPDAIEVRVSVVPYPGEFPGDPHDGKLTAVLDMKINETKEPKYVRHVWETMRGLRGYKLNFGHQLIGDWFWHADN